MTYFARILCFAAALIFMSAPSMACCVTGDHSAPVTEQAAAPCHDISHEASNDMPSEPTSCASCDDCVIVNSADLDLSPAVNASSIDVEFMALASRVPLSLRSQRYVQTTGPPPRLRLPQSTLITLKQRLTI